MARDQIRLVSSPFWIKIGPCFPEFDKKYLLHAVGVTFGGVLRSEILGEFCRLRVKLNVQRPLCRGIFVSIGNGNKFWIPFKYEKLPNFCFGCGMLGHSLHDCTEIIPAEENRIREDPPFSLALKAELNLVGRESLKLNALAKKLQTQCSYVDNSTENQEEYSYNEQSSGMIRGMYDDAWLTTKAVDLEIQNEEGSNDGNNEDKNANISNSARKPSWKRMKSMGVMKNHEIKRKLHKRKLAEIIQDEYKVRETQAETLKRARHGGQVLTNEVETHSLMEYSNQNGSAAVNRQADRTQ
ncbi:hypothetical protein ES288_D10G144100v1 [Gossypium darwinii]|uniref:CCHC-type domain-containing protein n=1 Tax=Gossypium darwinii TaxID=34276 RepID=A0A5D2AZS3_GOSDA|nr:hypothetical protein ES288_D10G144100v1 [Gossypium darwinii]